MNIEEIQTKLEETTSFILDFYNPDGDPREMSWARLKLGNAKHDLLEIIRVLEDRIDHLENQAEYDAIALAELGIYRRRSSSMKYLIFSVLETGLNDGEPMFWQNDQGWVSIHDATQFDLADISMVPPMGQSDTCWMTEELAQKMVNSYHWYTD